MRTGSVSALLLLKALSSEHAGQVDWLGVYLHHHHLCDPRTGRGACSLGALVSPTNPGHSCT